MIYYTLVIYVTKIYVVRHCETDANAAKIFQGHTDNDVNELGVAQLEALRGYFKDIHLDAVYTSPLLRTLRTATAIAGNKGVPIIKMPDLIELNGGVYEGKTYSRIAEENPGFMEMWGKRPWEFNPQNGESMVSAYDRIYNCIKEIAEESRDKTIAVASHGGVIRCLLCRIIKNDIEKLPEVPFVDNTGVTLIEADGDMNFTVKVFNDNSHLSEDLKNENSNVPLGEY